MFSNALKSFQSNIGGKYTLSAQPSSYSGPWKIYDAKNKSTGKAVSVFVFEKKSLEPPQRPYRLASLLLQLNHLPNPRYYPPS